MRRAERRPEERERKRERRRFRQWYGWFERLRADDRRRGARPPAAASGPVTGGSGGAGGAVPTGGVGGGPEPPGEPVLRVYGLAYGNESYVATAGLTTADGQDERGRIYQSAHGVAWELVADELDFVPSDVEFGNGVFVTLATYATYPPLVWYSAGYVSEDGRDWRQVDVPADHVGQTLAFGNGVFVAVGDRGRLRSTDGVEWTNSGPSEEHAAYSGQVEFAAGLFVTLPGSGVESVLIGTGTGDDWEDIDLSPSETLWYDPVALRAVGDSFRGIASHTCCFGETPDATHYRTLHSSDGRTWVIDPGELRPQPPEIVLDDGNVCIAFVGNSALAGPDCNTLDVRHSGIFARSVLAVGGRYFVAGDGRESGSILASDDGLWWMKVL